jgi:hypothetical protein
MFWNGALDSSNYFFKLTCFVVYSFFSLIENIYFYT